MVVNSELNILYCIFPPFPFFVIFDILVFLSTLFTRRKNPGEFLPPFFILREEIFSADFSYTVPYSSSFLGFL
jgi:hypothetical protein